jgi:hypothetical protein
VGSVYEILKEVLQLINWHFFHHQNEELWIRTFIVSF